MGPGGHTLRRFLTAVAAMALTVGGLAVTAGATVTSSSVTGTGMCFGYAGAGGCQAGFGGSSIGRAGATNQIGVAMTVATTLTGPADSVTIDASSLAPGMTFSGSPGDYQLDNNTTSEGCAIYPQPVMLSNSGQTVTVHMPTLSGCAPAAGTSIVILVSNAVNPPTTGTYSLDVWTSQDTTPVATNTFTIVAPPGAPTSPTIAPGNGTVTLGWTDPASDGGSAITGYDAYCSPTSPPSTSGTPSATVSGATATSVDVTGLTNGTPQYCVVTAVNTVGQSAASSPVVSATPSTVPDAPTAPTASSGNGTVTLGWTDPASDGGSAITGYDAYCSPTSPPSTSGTPSATVSGPTATSVTVTGLANGTAQYCVVTAVNADGASAASSPVVSATPAPTPPDAPTAPTIAPGNGTVTLGWTDPASDGGSAITGYDAYCSPTSPPSTSGTPSATVSGATATSVDVTGLTNGTPQYCVVTAVNTVGQSAASSPVVSATPSTVPDAPTAPTASSGNGTVTLGWTDPASDGGSAITGYDAYCSPTSPPSTSGTPSATVSGPTATSVTVTGLANGTAQYCVVTAVNGDGASAASTPVVSATPSTVPGAPTAPTIATGNGTVTLGWTDPASDGGSAITGYDAYCSPTSPPSTSGTPSATASGATATSVTVTGLTNGVTVHCVVTAVNGVGQSAASLPVVGGTPVAPSPGCSSTGTGSASFPGGYWLAGADGAVFSCGSAPFLGSLTSAGVIPAKPIVGIAGTPDHGGYWLVASDGGIFAFGDAHFYGSMGGQHLNQPIVGIATTPEGGYYEVAADGGLFAFGPGAAFHGSMGGLPLNQPVVGMAVTGGGGYYEVASDGGLFAFGPGAAFHGSMGGLPLNKPVVGMAATGGGYYEVASDGGVFAFGVPFHGSTGCLSLAQPIVAIVVAPDASTVGAGAACGVASPQAPGGYQFVAGDGGVFSFGNAVFAGSLGGRGVDDVVGLATS